MRVPEDTGEEALERLVAVEAEPVRDVLVGPHDDHAAGVDLDDQGESARLVPLTPHHGRRGLPHAYDNRTEADSRALFWVSPTGKLPHLFDQLQDLCDPAEVVRQSALSCVKFLQPG